MKRFSILALVLVLSAFFGQTILLAEVTTPVKPPVTVTVPPKKKVKKTVQTEADKAQTAVKKTINVSTAH